jgi:hypothetical protein
MWRAKIVPVITCALGTIEGLHKNLQLLTSHPSVTELQTIVILSTAHIIPKVLG